MSLPYYKRFPRDFLDGTIGLPLETKGAYAIILDLIYMKDGRLPDDARYIAGHLGCSVRKWTAIRDDLIVAGKIQVQDRIISNSRADDLLEDHRKYQAKQAENRANPNKNKGSESPASNQSESQSETREEEAKASVGSAAPTPTALDIREPSSPEMKADPWTRDPDFAAFWKAATDHGRKRSSQAKAWAEWRKAVKVLPGAELAATMPRYVAGDEDCKRTGGPGLHLWLRDRKFEHWTGVASAGAAVPAAIFDGPPALRDSVVKLLGEPFARTWIDSCRWDPATRTLLARNAFGLSKLNDDLGLWMRQKDVRAAIFGADAGEPV